MKIYGLLDLKRALAACMEHKDAKNGLFIVSNELSRGIDMKFGEDSYVICYNSHHYRLTGTDCYQMVGRSSRTRGISKGCIFLEKEANTPDSIPDVTAYIEGLLECELVSDNIRNLAQLLQFWRGGY